MTAVVYPSSLPGPSLSQVTPAERRLLSDVTGGPQQARGVQRDYLATQRVEWPLFTAAQADVFNVWWRDTLVQGGSWFTSTWPAPQGWVSVVRRFVGVPQWSHVGGGFWRLSAQVQMRGRGLAPQGFRIRDDLIAWWDATALLTSGSETIADQHTNNLTAAVSVTGQCSTIAGINGGAVRIPSYSAPFQHIGTQQLSSLLKLGNQPFAFGRWVRLFGPMQNDDSGRLLMGRLHTGPGNTLADRSYGITYRRDANLFQCFLSADGTTGNGSSISAGVETDWHLVVCSYSGTQISFWVDGGNASVVAHTGGALATSDAFFSFDYRFGSPNVPAADNDVVAKVTVNQDLMSAFVLGRAITPAEVTYLYNGGIRRLYAELP